MKTERFERTEENVDNRIQYVGQIAREGKLSKIKPKSRYHRKCKNKREEVGKRKKKFLFLISDFLFRRTESGRRTCSLHHVKSY